MQLLMPYDMLLLLSVLRVYRFLLPRMVTNI